MATQAKSNLQAAVYDVESVPNPVTSGKLVADKFYQILSKAKNNSALPAGLGVKQYFRSPHSLSSGITLTAGDSVRLLDLRRICKTEISMTLSEDSVEATTDCDSTVVTIPSGKVTLEGTFNSFMQYDIATNALKDFSAEITRRWFDTLVNDRKAGNAAGSYQYKARDNSPKFLAVLWNKDTKVDGTQEWLLAHINITGMTFGGANDSIQPRDVSFSASNAGKPTWIKFKNVKQAEVDLASLEANV